MSAHQCTLFQELAVHQYYEDQAIPEEADSDEMSEAEVEQCLHTHCVMHETELAMPRVQQWSRNLRARRAEAVELLAKAEGLAPAVPYPSGAPAAPSASSAFFQMPFVVHTIIQHAGDGQRRAEAAVARTLLSVFPRGEYGHVLPGIKAIAYEHCYVGETRRAALASFVDDTEHARLVKSCEIKGSVIHVSASFDSALKGLRSLRRICLHFVAPIDPYARGVIPFDTGILTALAFARTAALCRQEWAGYEQLTELVIKAPWAENCANPEFFDRLYRLVREIPSLRLLDIAFPAFFPSFRPNHLTPSIAHDLRHLSSELQFLPTFLLIFDTQRLESLRIKASPCCNNHSWRQPSLSLPAVGVQSLPFMLEWRSVDAELRMRDALNSSLDKLSAPLTTVTRLELVDATMSPEICARLAHCFPNVADLTLAPRFWSEPVVISPGEDAMGLPLGSLPEHFARLQQGPRQGRARLYDARDVSLSWFYFPTEGSPRGTEPILGAVCITRAGPWPLLKRVTIGASFALEDGFLHELAALIIRSAQPSVALVKFGGFAFSDMCAHVDFQHNHHEAHDATVAGTGERLFRTPQYGLEYASVQIRRHDCGPKLRSAWTTRTRHVIHSNRVCLRNCGLLQNPIGSFRE